MDEDFFSWLLREKGIALNDQQRAGVENVDGCGLLVATPGSGKTTVIVCRTALLLRSGVPASRILTLTYGKQSQMDLSSRFASLFPELPAPRFSTFHALCLRILRQCAVQTGGELFALLPDSAALVRALLAQQTGGYVGEDLLRAAMNALEYACNAMLDSEAAKELKVEGCDFARLFTDYAHCKREKRQMDFGDLLTYALRALNRYPTLCSQWQQAYDYIQIDEAQDTSPIQQRIADLMAARCGRLFLVGDEDQSIYGFRGAAPDYLMDFERTHPGARVLRMETNYRSSPEIVQAAGRLIQYNANRRCKTMHPAGPAQGRVERQELRDWNAQADYVCKRAQELEPGRTLGVLFRNNDSAPVLCDALLRAGCSFSLSRRDGPPGLFSHYTLRNLRSLIRLSFNPGDGEAFWDVRNRIRRGLPLWAAQRARRSGEDVFALLCALPELSAADREAIARRGERIAAYKTQRAYAAVSAMIDDFYLDGGGACAQKTDALLTLAMGVDTLDQYTAKLSELELWMESERPEQGPVFLSTIHAAKGLEYDEVIVVDAQKGVLPSSDKRDTPEEMRAFEEETRLMYVAATRARSRLTVLCASHSHGRPCPPSLYLDRMLPPLGAVRKTAPMVSAQVNRGGLPRPGAIKAPKPAAQDWVGARVQHKKFGSGVVLDVRDGVGTVRFADGERALDLAVCVQAGVLSRKED